MSKRTLKIVLDEDGSRKISYLRNGEPRVTGTIMVSTEDFAVGTTIEVSEPEK